MLETIFLVSLFSGPALTETSQGDDQGQTLVAAQMSKAADSHAQPCEPIPETKVIETLTSHIK